MFNAKSTADRAMIGTRYSSRNPVTDLIGPPNTSPNERKMAIAAIVPPRLSAPKSAGGIREAPASMQMMGFGNSTTIGHEALANPLSSRRMNDPPSPILRSSQRAPASPYHRPMA